MRLTTAGATGAAQKPAPAQVPEQPETGVPAPDNQVEHDALPPSPDELEQRYGAPDTSGVAAPQEERTEAYVRPAEQPSPMQLTSPRLLSAFTKMFRAIMVFPGLAQPGEVAEAVSKISKISISAHQLLRERQINVPLTTINELISEQWTASLFRQGELAPEISVDWVVSAFSASSELAEQCNRDPLIDSEQAAFLGAVASLIVPLEQYQLFVATVTREKLNIDTDKLYLALADHFYSSIDELTKMTPLANAECKVSLYRSLQEIFQSVWADWRDRIYSSTKKLEDESQAYQYLLGVDPEA
ncbi:MAG: hypothetical protein ACK8QZ_06590, partial [Anaerolineales bacterium]